MTTTPPNTSFGSPSDPGHPGPIDPSSLTPGALLRAVADGEISPSAANRLETQIPDWAARVEAERSLRSAIARAMGADQPAPASVRAGVEALLRSSGSEQRDDAPAPMPFVNTRNVRFRHRLTSFAAIAAVLTLCAGMLYLAGGQLWQGPQTPPGSSASPALLSASLGEQVQRVHHSTASASQAKLPARTTNAAAAAVEQAFPGVPQSIHDGIARLERDGYTFVGFGPCSLPVKGSAARLTYKSAQSDVSVSLFILAGAGCIKLEDGGCCVRTGELGEHRGTIVGWREGRFNFLIYSCCPDALDDAKVAFNAPVPERPER